MVDVSVRQKDVFDSPLSRNGHKKTKATGIDSNSVVKQRTNAELLRTNFADG